MPERKGFEFRGAMSHKPDIFYLAYGSNLSVERLKKRCPDARVVGTANIPGYRLLFKKSGSGFYATIEQDANCCVPAAVYRISEYDEALLNRYEGYPKYYYKKYFHLSVRRLDSGKLMRKKQDCMAYILHEDRLLGRPGVDYFRILDNGYADWEFDTDILDKGLSDSIGVEAAEQYLREYESV